jgi:hypothetical protein
VAHSLAAKRIASQREWFICVRVSWFVVSHLKGNRVHRHADPEKFTTCEKKQKPLVPLRHSD